MLTVEKNFLSTRYKRGKIFAKGIILSVLKNFETADDLKKYLAELNENMKEMLAYD